MFDQLSFFVDISSNSYILHFSFRYATPSLKLHSIPISRPSGQTIQQSASSFFKGANQILLTNVKPGKIFAFSFGSACVLSRLCVQAHCKSKPSRLVGLKERDDFEPNFDWKGFFWMVWPDIWSLIGAITVCISSISSFYLCSDFTYLYMKISIGALTSTCPNIL